MTEPDFYHWDEDAEELTYEAQHEAVMNYLESTHTAQWPETVEIYAWTRQTISEKQREWMAESVAEHFLDSAFEEYRDPDHGPRAEVSTHALNFVNAVIDDIGVWACERSKEHDEVINVAAWVRENEPSWLTDDPEIAAWVASRPA